MSDNALDNYSIIVSGPSGSGKTVYLASMFKKLSTQSPDIPFFIFTGSALNKRFGLDDSMFRELGRYFDLLARNKENEIRREREKLNIKQQETLKRVVDRKTAVKHALTCFERVQLELKQKFPEADLSHER